MSGQGGTAGAERRPSVRFIDLFSGIGAMRLGFEQACRESGMEPRCAGFSEIDPAATKVYLRHFPGTPVLGDIRALAASHSIPECEVILGGFPCPSYSSAGARRGFADDRGKLFFSLARVIGRRRPAAFLLENVKGLQTHNGGKTFVAVIQVLRDQLGYTIRHAVLNSRDFDVPQNRPRIYIAGFRKGAEAFRFPGPTDSTKRLKDVLEVDPVDPCHYISEGALASMRVHKARHEALGHGFGYRVADPDKDVACALMLGGQGHERNLIVDRRISEFPLLPGRDSPISRECLRRLTPHEWERLQGLPDEFTAGQADGPRYDQLGNAVSVPVVRVIARRMLEALERASPEAAPAAAARKTPPRSPGPPVAVEICAGCGGLTTGLARAGIDAAVACEIDRDAAESCRLNHPGTVVVEKDITTEEAKEAVIAALGGRECDLLAAGLPCQAYSLLGLRDPADPRGSLFEHFVDLVRRIRPKVAIIENVPGILSMRRPDGTPVMHAIAREFRAIGYAVCRRAVNAADFGDPQSRQRVVVFAWREGAMPRLAPTHDADGGNGLPRWRTVRDASGDLESAPENPKAWHVFTRSGPAFVKVLRNTPIGSGAKPSYREAHLRCWPDVPAPTVKGCNGSVFVHYAEDRLMTPRELARLQSFPDSYRFHGNKGEVLRQVGNAVPVGLATAIGKAVISSLRSEPPNGPSGASK